jgi:pyrroloquinoline quinone biosynthesis protein B
VRPRTQAGLAVSADGATWALFNASPDLGQQIRQCKPLQPQSGIRGSPIRSVVLTGAEIDQVVGLLSLREREPFTLFATPATLRILADSPVFAALADEVVTRHPVLPGERLQLPGGLQAEIFATPGKIPLYLEGGTPELASETATCAGIEVSAANARMVYVPGAAAVTSAMMDRLRSADVVFFDGTLFQDDEMIKTGTGSKTGRRMGHMPIDGESGSLALLRSLTGRRIFIHINNTNPVLVDGSRERLEVERSGWEIAEDGLEVVL